MAITPQTEIRLLKVPFQLDNKNQLTFKDKETQTNYFTSLENIEINRASYQRKDNILNFPMHIDKIINYNYVMYKNNNYGNKWFYAFISDMKYENDNLTYITIKTDVFQTWQFDIIYRKMFVEREHVISDKIGEHTIPEGLETGELIVDNIVKYEMGKMKYIIQCTEWTDYQEGENKPLATNYGGIYSAGRSLYCRRYYIIS